MKPSGAEVGGRMSFPSWASRLAWASTMAALALIAAPAAKADVVQTFDLSGSQVTGDTFAGTIDLDFTQNTATSVDVSVDGLSVYTQIISWSFALSGNPAVVDVSDASGDVLTLFFTVPTPNTLAGFYGGEIAVEGAFGGGTGFLFGATGNITLDPADLSDLPDPPAVPEPSTWVMMLLGFIGLGLAAKGRRAVRFLAGKA
jgi:hypothetical protein